MNDAFYRLAVKEALVLYNSMIHILLQRKKKYIEIYYQWYRKARWRAVKQSVVMSSIVEILVYIRLHEKNGKKTFSKIGFHSGDLSDWKVFIVGYQDTCSWKAKIRVLLCHRLSKFWFTSVYTRKTKKRRFQKSDSTPESFQIEKWLSLDRCSWKATPPKKKL